MHIGIMHVYNDQNYMKGTTIYTYLHGRNYMEARRCNCLVLILQNVSILCRISLQNPRKVVVCLVLLR